MEHVYSHVHPAEITQVTFTHTREPMPRHANEPDLLCQCRSALHRPPTKLACSPSLERFDSESEAS